MTLQLIVLIVLGVVYRLLSVRVLAVTTSRILRAATYLLLVLFGTAGIYFLQFSTTHSWEAVQLLIYAGGITVLYVFSLFFDLFTGRNKAERLKNGKMVAGAISDYSRTGYLSVRHAENEFFPLFCSW